LDLPFSDGKSLLTLSGSPRKHRVKLKQQEEANRLPLHSLDIIGFALPHGHPQGYGVVSHGLPAPVIEEASSAVRLPDGAVIYMDRELGAVFLYGGISAVGKRKLHDGDRITLNIATEHGVRAHTATWQERKNLPGEFRGELVISPELDCLLARGILSEDLPEDLFPDYRDITIGRGPLRLESRDGRSLSLVFNQSAAHPVFIMTSNGSGFRTYAPDNYSVINLSPRISMSTIGEFIIGSTHYRLREIADPSSERKSLEPSLAPVGGIA
jgi:hypothetical protein